MPQRKFNRHLSIFVYLLFGFFLISCNKGFTLKIQDQDVLAFGAQDSCNFITTNVLANSLRISWKNSTPIYFIITESVPSEFDVDIHSAAANWNSVVGKDLIRVARDSNFTKAPGNDGANAIYWMKDWEPENASQQARTAVRWDISRIVDADIRINAKNFTFYKTADANSGGGQVNFESLILHELGHAAGLTHISNINSVMQVSLKDQTLRIQPADIDITSLKCEY